MGRESLYRVTLREQHGGAPSLLEDGQPVAGRATMGLWSELALVGRLRGVYRGCNLASLAPNTVWCVALRTLLSLALVADQGTLRPRYGL